METSESIAGAVVEVESDIVAPDAMGMVDASDPANAAAAQRLRQLVDLLVATYPPEHGRRDGK